MSDGRPLKLIYMMILALSALDAYGVRREDCYKKLGKLDSGSISLSKLSVYTIAMPGSPPHRCIGEARDVIDSLKLGKGTIVTLHELGPNGEVIVVGTVADGTGTSPGGELSGDLVLERKRTDESNLVAPHSQINECYLSPDFRWECQN